MASGLLRRVTALLVAVAMTAGMAACGGSSKPASTSTARQSAKTSAQTGAGLTQPSTASGQASGHSRDRLASGVRRLPCQELIGTQPPERDMHVVLGVVALPTSPHLRRALQTARSGLDDPSARLFAKWGLVIRPRARLRLIVPHGLANQLSIGWGNAGEGHRGTTIVVDGCTGPPGAKWLAYAGGYYVRDPICAPLIVAAHRQRRRVLVGVGKACPGQLPPPQPTQG